MTGKELTDKVRGEFSSLNRTELFRICRRSKVQPKVVLEFMDGKKTITLRILAKLLDEKSRNKKQTKNESHD